MAASRALYEAASARLTRMWLDGTFYCGDPDAYSADVSARAAAKQR